MVIKLIERTPKQYMKVYEVDIIDIIDPLVQLNGTLQEVKDTLYNELVKLDAMKINITLKVIFEKPDKKIFNDNDDNDDVKFIYKTAYFASKTVMILQSDNIEDTIHEAIDQIMNKIGNWMSEGSGWTIKEVMNHYVNIYKYKPLRSSSYTQLPEGLKNKKGLVNIKNDDNQCFRWCHLAYLFPAKQNPNRVSHYRSHIGSVNYDGIKFPVSIKQIHKIEEQNDIRFNIFGYENDTICPLYISRKVCERTCEMLSINNHYVWIKDFSKLMYKQTEHDGKNISVDIVYNVFQEKIYCKNIR